MTKFNSMYLSLNRFYLIAVIISLCSFYRISSKRNSDGNSELPFLEKYAGTSWTNGTDTIKFKNISGAIEDWSDIVSPKMWYLYSVDGAFYVLPCEECYTGNECHMCGYNAIKSSKDTLELFWEYQNDFYAEGEGVKFYFQSKDILISKITRGGYFNEYSSNEVQWFPLNTNLISKQEVFNKNKKVLEDFFKQKAIEREETEKELFDY